MSTAALVIRSPSRPAPAPLSPVNAPPPPSLLARALALLRAPLAQPLRHLVSKKKRRFVDAASGADLDLAYVTDRVLATGFPAVGVEALYRNAAPALRAFLSARHGPAHARVWNLCAERGYAPARVGAGGVAHALAWWDHHPPPFALLRPLCAELQRWLDAEPANVAVIREHARRRAARDPTRTVLTANAPSRPPPPP